MDPDGGRTLPGEVLGAGRVGGAGLCGSTAVTTGVVSVLVTALGGEAVLWDRVVLMPGRSAELGPFACTAKVMAVPPSTTATAVAIAAKRVLCKEVILECIPALVVGIVRVVTSGATVG